MPEGDTIFRAAAVLARALAGRTLARVDTRVPEVAEVLRRAPAAGRTISGVHAVGKHLLMVLRGPGGGELTLPAPLAAAGMSLQRPDLVLHTHMRMNGSWHVYRPGERWRRSPRSAVVVLHTEAFVAPCFDAPVVELLGAEGAIRHPALVRLGPDAALESFDAAEALRRLDALGAEPIGVALLDQRVLAGVGNVYKSEVLFLERIDPFAPVATLEAPAKAALLARAADLLQRNLSHGPRRTRGSLGRGGHLWVYGRAGEPCRVCGTPILRHAQGADQRVTYHCPRCQSSRVDRA